MGQDMPTRGLQCTTHQWAVGRPDLDNSGNMKQGLPRSGLDVAPQPVGLAHQGHIGWMLEIAEPDNAGFAVGRPAVMTRLESFDADGAEASARHRIERSAAHCSEPDDGDVKSCHEGDLPDVRYDCSTPPNGPAAPAYWGIARMKGFGAIIMCLLAAATAAAKEPERRRLRPSFTAVERIRAPVPLPRPRPRPPGVAPIPSSHTPAMEEFASNPETKPESPQVAAEPPPPSACFLRLTAGLAVAQTMALTMGPGECGATDVVRLEAIILPDRRQAAVSPPATLRCSMAEAVAQWVREDIVPALAPLGAPLATVDNFASYECRGRNRIAGAKMSEHGLANAIDVRAFVLADRKRIELTDRAVSMDLRNGLRASACARFTTVLGPGSDGFHESHVHVDLAERRNGYRLCQWDVRPLDEGIPLPPERPAEAPPRGL